MKVFIIHKFYGDKHRLVQHKESVLIIFRGQNYNYFFGHQIKSKKIHIMVMLISTLFTTQLRQTLSYDDTLYLKIKNPGFSIQMEKKLGA